MSERAMSDQLNHARAALIAGRRAEAQALFAQIVRSSPHNGEAWYLLGQTLDDPQKRHDCETRAAAAGFVLPVSARPASLQPLPAPNYPPASYPPASYPQPAAQAPRASTGLIIGVGLAALFLIVMVAYALSGGASTNTGARPTSVLEEQTPGPPTTQDYALAENPEHATTAQDFERLGFIYLTDENYAEALAAYNRGLKLDPHWSALYYGRGSVYSEQGEHEKALADFSEAIYFTGEHDYAPFVARGWEYIELENYSRARADFDRAVGLNAAHLNNYYSRGAASLRLNMLDSAFTDFTYVIQQDPAWFHAYYGRGLVLRKQRKVAAAIRDFETFLEYSSDPVDRADAEKILRELRRR